MKKTKLLPLDFVIQDLVGVDYTNIHLIGSNNRELIINGLQQTIDNITQNTNGLKEEKDQYANKLILCEYDLEINVNAKLVENRQSIIDHLVSLRDESVKPELQILRKFSTSKPGDDVFFYVDKSDHPKTFTTGWHNAILLAPFIGDRVHLFSYKKWNPDGALEGRYFNTYIHSPECMKMKDFLLIREYLSQDIEKEFIDIWCMNFHDRNLKKSIDEIKESIITSNETLVIQKTSKNVKKTCIKDLHKIAHSGRFFNSVSDDLVEEYKISL